MALSQFSRDINRYYDRISRNIAEQAFKKIIDRRLLGRDGLKKFEFNGDQVVSDIDTIVVEELPLIYNDILADIDEIKSNDEWVSLMEPIMRPDVIDMFRKWGDIAFYRFDLDPLEFIKGIDKWMSFYNRAKSTNLLTLKTVKLTDSINLSNGKTLTIACSLDRRYELGADLKGIYMKLKKHPQCGLEEQRYYSVMAYKMREELKIQTNAIISSVYSSNNKSDQLKGREGLILMKIALEVSRI